MIKLIKLLVAIVGIFFGGWVAFAWIVPTMGIHTHKTIGFLPYWLINSVDQSHFSTLTTLTYFGLEIKPDGTIQKYQEPGWNALNSGKVTPLLTEAKNQGLELSLLVSNMNTNEILELVSEATTSAQNLVGEVEPIMKQYGFTDLNLDIESFTLASHSARQQFTTFVSEVKKELLAKHLGTLTIEMSPSALIKPFLIDPAAIGAIADTVVLMTYDYSYTGSFVAGPVAPLGGVPGHTSFDVQTAIAQAERVIPPKKLVLGLPLYGYEWETITASPHAAIIPGSGRTATYKRIKELLETCLTCTSQIDPVSGENYIIYPDPKDASNRVIFYGEPTLMKEKLDLIPWWKGAAVWALGYEGEGLMEPLASFKNEQLLLP